MIPRAPFARFSSGDLSEGGNDDPTAQPPLQQQQQPQPARPPAPQNPAAAAAAAAPGQPAQQVRPLFCMHSISAESVRSARIPMAIRAAGTADPRAMAAHRSGSGTWATRRKDRYCRRQRQLAAQLPVCIIDESGAVRRVHVRRIRGESGDGATYLSRPSLLAGTRHRTATFAPVRAPINPAPTPLISPPDRIDPRSPTNRRENLRFERSDTAHTSQCSVLLDYAGKAQHA